MGDTGAGRGTGADGTPEDIAAAANSSDIRFPPFQEIQGMRKASLM
jgi:hypothetical protein